MGKRGVFAPDTENKETLEQRKAEEEIRQQESYRIPLRSRIQSVSGPGKAVLATSTLILGFVAYLLTKMMQTGSPAEDYLSLEVAIIGVALIGVAGGVHLHKWADARIGTMYNVYETAGGEPDVEKVEFFKHERMNIGKEEVLQQLHPSNLLGIFRRRMLVGQHRELRASPKPLSDVVTHSVPPGKHAFEVDDGTIINLTRGEPNYAGSAEAPADVYYSSPNNLSYERAVQHEQSKERMRIERDAAQTTAAAYSSELDELSEMIINREWQDKRELMDLLDEYEEMQRSRTTTEIDNRQGGIQRSAQADGSSVLESAERNGSRKQESDA